MANSTAGTLITRCLDNMSRSAISVTRSGVTNATKGIEWLNGTLLEISRTHDFKEMRKLYSMATEVGRKTYTFPDGWKTIVSLRLFDGLNSRKLVKRTQREFDARVPFPEGESTGIPTVYVPDGNLFDLFKIPDNIYTIYARTVIWPTAVTSQAAVLDYESIRDDMIVAGMTYRGFEQQQMYEDADYWKKEFRRLLRDAESQDTYTVDWDPIGEGFDSERSGRTIGEYWNDPFVKI